MATRTLEREKVIELAKTMPAEKLASWYEYGLFIQSRSEVETDGLMDEETLAWHEADLSKLGDYEPYDWGDKDPLTIGEPLQLGKQVKK